ncbi:universal stress protein [Natrinema sp. H-ect4]|uniref:universal stress protein n=1 Tax=Natrinema sp. H-ect4 TaxID=3242699 RepID=UPI0035A8B5B3
MYDDILVATDGSDIAANAASMGISLARRFGGEIHALAIAEERRDNAARRSKREADAEAIAAQARQADCEADAIVRSGRPADEIPATATEVGADLIVLGTHGRTGLSQALLGSVALEVLREARQPVLTVGPDAALEGPELDDVLLATDGWSGSRAATEHAISLADSADARLHALYAVDVNFDAPEQREAFEEHGKKTMTAVADRAEERGVEVTRTVVDGSAHEVILEYAADADVDLLVMGTESKTTLERLVVGSVSQRVVPNASVPVVTVRTIDQ